MNKLHASVRINVRKLEGFGEIIGKARIHAGEELAAIVKGDLS
jgi:hypothetical protein